MCIASVLSQFLTVRFFCRSSPTHGKQIWCYPHPPNPLWVQHFSPFHTRCFILSPSSSSAPRRHTHTHKHTQADTHSVSGCWCDLEILQPQLWGTFWSRPPLNESSLSQSLMSCDWSVRWPTDLCIHLGEETCFTLSARFRSGEAEINVSVINHGLNVPQRSIFLPLH